MLDFCWKIVLQKSRKFTLFCHGAMDDIRRCQRAVRYVPNVILHCKHGGKRFAIKDDSEF